MQTVTNPSFKQECETEKLFLRQFGKMTSLETPGAVTFDCNQLYSQFNPKLVAYKKLSS